MKEALTNVLNGLVFGISNVIPGVSGGTIAVVLKFYDRLIESVNTLFKNFKKNMVFLVPLAIGAAAGIIGFSKILKPAFDYYPFHTNIFFVGLIAGSIPLLWNLANKNGFKRTYLIPFAAALAVIVLLAVMQRPIDTADIENARSAADASSSTSAAKLLPPSGVFDCVYLFAAGAIASAAMLVPGVSGSFMMILLGTYNRVISSVSGLTQPDNAAAAVFTLIPVGLGIITGIFVVAKAIEFLMKKFYSYSYYAVLGLVGGSIFTILYTPKTYNSAATGSPVKFGAVSVITAALICAAGFIAAVSLGKEDGEKGKSIL